MPPGQGSGDAVSHERLPAPWGHHRLRQLCGGTGERWQAADDLQARHFHPGPHQAAESSICLTQKGDGE